MGGRHGAIQLNFQPPHFFLPDHSQLKLKNYQGKYIPTWWRDEYPELNNVSKEDLKSREGALFLEMTSATGRNEYDWKQKVIMALSIVDMGKILDVVEGRTKEGGQVQPCKIIHDPGAGTDRKGLVTKNLTISSPEGLRRGVIVTISETSGGETRRHTVPLSGDEVTRLAVCLRAVLPRALAWL
jgi:hypothetical protein